MAPSTDPEGTFAERAHILDQAPVVDEVRTPGHVARLCADYGWGEPGQFQGGCSCGWVGTVFTETRYVDGSGTVGTRQDALGEVLTHTGYDPEADRARSDLAVTALLQQISDATEAINRERQRTAELARAYASTASARG